MIEKINDWRHINILMAEVCDATVVELNIIETKSGKLGRHVIRRVYSRNIDRVKYIDRLVSKNVQDGQTTQWAMSYNGLSQIINKERNLLSLNFIILSGDLWLNYKILNSQLLDIVPIFNIVIQSELSSDLLPSTEKENPNSMYETAQKSVMVIQYYHVDNFSTLLFAGR